MIRRLRHKLIAALYALPGHRFAGDPGGVNLMSYLQGGLCADAILPCWPPMTGPSPNTREGSAAPPGEAGKETGPL